MSEQNEQILEIGTEELQELMNVPEDKLPPIEIDFEHYNTDEFYRGIEDISHLCGEITALFNVGLSEQAVMDFILNRETIKYNLETSKINKDMNVEIAKQQRIVAEKHEL